MENIFNLNDKRLNTRAQLSLERVQASPDKSLPNLFDNYAELEAFYRLIKNDRIQEDDLLNNISSFTSKNVEELDEVAVIHDTTFINPKFNIKSKTLGRRGLGTHLSLVVDAGSIPNVFGTINIEYFMRNPDGTKTIESSESSRWLTGVERAEKELGNNDCIHIMDREGDLFSHFFTMNEEAYRYVIRASHNRHIENDYYDRLYEAMADKRPFDSFITSISKREESHFSKERKIHPKRDSREIKLNVSACNIILTQSPSLIRTNKVEMECEVNVVRVWEDAPPKGEKAIEWVLITSEDIRTKKQVRRIINLYRRRWLIEEFFKGLKTGCKIEEKQFETVDSWKKLILFYLPVTTKILNLRVMDKVNISTIKECLTDDQIKILKHLSKKTLRSVSDFMYALASLGGHVKYNGPPGWLTLFRGMKDLVMLEKGWKLR